LALIALVVLGCACGSPPDAQVGGAGSKEHQSIAEYDVARDLFVVRGDAREALRHALRAVELDGNNSDASHLCSLIYLSFCAVSEQDCRLDEAERHVRKALKSNGDLREAKNTLGVILIHKKRYAEALAVLEPLSRDMLYSTPETVWGNIGWAYYLLGDNKKAIASLRRALALQPEFCVGAYRLALAYEKDGDFRSALDAASRAVKTDRPECRSFQDAFRVRARIALRMGDYDRARADFEKCRDLDAGTDSGQECVAALAKLR